MIGKYIIHDFLMFDVEISQAYGANKSYYMSLDPGLTLGHEGVDFATVDGTPFYAPFDGIVVRDANSPKDYGIYVVIWDPVQNIAMWFCHLQDVVVHISDHVKAGDLLGHTDNTGNTTGPHCHVNFVETDENGVRINMDNGEEGFLDVMDPSLVNYPWLACTNGVEETVVPDQTYYKIGDEIHIDTPVSTGSSPDNITLNYGTISPQAPAKVTGIIVFNGITYYEINQTYIGGGTGFAIASQIDDHVIVSNNKTVPQQPLTQPATSVLADETITVASSQTVSNLTAEVPPIIPSVEPQKKINELTVQNTGLVVKLKEMSDKYKTDLGNYTGILAAGYEKAEDIFKALEEVASENTGLKKQMLQILERNKSYHLDMASKEQEDATAIENGMKFEKMYNAARNELVTIAKAFKTKPSQSNILVVADNLRSAATNAIKQLQKKQTQESIQQAVDTVQATLETPQVKESGMNLLERLLTFNWKGGTA